MPGKRTFVDRRRQKHTRRVRGIERTPYRRPAMSTPYQQSREQPPRCIEMSDTPAAVPRQDGRPSHRPAAPIQRFNSKNIGWPAWFRHFKAVADVQGWDKDQRALQMVSYLDEKAMKRGTGVIRPGTL